MRYIILIDDKGNVSIYGDSVSSLDEMREYCRDNLELVQDESGKKGATVREEILEYPATRAVCAAELDGSIVEEPHGYDKLIKPRNGMDDDALRPY